MMPVLPAVLVLLGQTPLPRLTPGNHDLSLRFGDRTRRYIVHVPPQVRDGRADRCGFFSGLTSLYNHRIVDPHAH